MVLPVARSSAKESEAKEVDKVTGSSTLVIVTTNSLSEVVVPSEALKVKVNELVDS